MRAAPFRRAAGGGPSHRARNGGVNMAEAKPRLGTILLNAREIDNTQLREAVAKQKIFKRKIGEILIMMGAINPEQLDVYLMVQQAMNDLGTRDHEVDHNLLKSIMRDRVLSDQASQPTFEKDH